MNKNLRVFHEAMKFKKILWKINPSKETKFNKFLINFIRNLNMKHKQNF